MKKEKWVFQQDNSNTELYFDGSVDWSWASGTSPKDRPSELSSKYVFNSENDERVLEVYKEFPDIRNKYTLVDVSNIFYKPISPYSLYNPTPPKLQFGKENEYCGTCGQNIIANEPYIIWPNKRRICLHCVMVESSNIKKLHKKLPTHLKKEWNINGKQGFEKRCTDFI